MAAAGADFFVGEGTGAGFGEGGLSSSAGTSVGSSPLYTAPRSIFAGKPSFPPNHSLDDMAGLDPTAGG